MSHAARLLDRRHRIGAALRIEIEHADRHAVLRQPFRAGRANAGRRAGDQGYFD